jgi:hypothetical protein
MDQSAAIIEIPLPVWLSADSLDDLENWLLANNPKLIAELQRRKQEMLSHKTISLDELEKRWVTK